MGAVNLLHPMNSKAVFESAVAPALPVDPVLRLSRRSALHVRRGRQWLCAVMLPVAGAEAAIFHAAAHTDLTSAVRCATILLSIYLLVVTVALWHRQKPARSLLAGLLLLSAAAQAILLTDTLAQVPGFHAKHFLAVTIGIHLVAAFALLLLRPLRRLTTHARLYTDFRLPIFSPHYRCLAR